MLSCASHCTAAGQYCDNLIIYYPDKIGDYITLGLTDIIVCLNNITAIHITHSSYIQQSIAIT